MELLTLYFLPVILTLGIFTSYEDIKNGKIRNRHVATAMVLSIAIHCLLAIFNVIGQAQILYSLLNVFLAIAVGAAVWHFNAWSAGDAKLYVAFISLVPFSNYKHSTAPIPVFDIIINTAIPLFLFLIVEMIIKSNKKNITRSIKRIANWRYLTYTLLTVFSLSGILAFLFQYAGIIPNYIYMVISIIILSALLKKILSENLLPFLIFVSIIRIFLNTPYLTSINFWTEFLTITLSYTSFSIFLTGLSEIYTRGINIYKLKPGMTTAEAISKNGLLLKTENSTKENSLIPGGKRLKEEEIATIKKMHKEGKLHFNNLRIEQTQPMAPFMFFGTLTTIVAEGNVILFIKSIF
jgi:Flp pilus assembly protein protease CpaA